MSSRHLTDKVFEVISYNILKSKYCATSY